MTLPGKSYTAAEMTALAYMAAGAAVGVVMQEHPRYVMPTETINGAIEALLEGCGVPTPPAGVEVTFG